MGYKYLATLNPTNCKTEGCKRKSYSLSPYCGPCNHKRIVKRKAGKDLFGTYAKMSDRKYVEWFRKKYG